jgi:hypothetical protein
MSKTFVSIDALISALASDDKDIKRKALKKVADDEVKISKPLAPVRTGALVRSIAISSISDNTATVTAIGGDKGRTYAIYQEYPGHGSHPGYMGVSNNQVFARAAKSTKEFIASYNFF